MRISKIGQRPEEERSLHTVMPRRLKQRCVKCKLAHGKEELAKTDVNTMEALDQKVHITMVRVVKRTCAVFFRITAGDSAKLNMHICWHTANRTTINRCFVYSTVEPEAML